MAAKILNFLAVGARWIKFSEWVDIKNELNMTKIRGSKIEVLPKQGPPKFELFNFLSRANKILKVTKHKEKIKFDKIWGY